MFKLKLTIVLSLVLIGTGLGFISGRFVLANLNNNQVISSPLIVSTSQQTASSAPIKTNEPKTEVCPLNGSLHTKSEKELWQKRRPLFVMIENHQDARPVAGLSNADIVYEAVAEGGITRFGAVFYCSQDQDVKIAPVRSARVYFIHWAAEYGNDPIYVHVGGAHCDPITKQGCLNRAKADALGLIRKIGWQGINDVNQFSVGFPTFYRDINRLGHPIAIEHTMTTSTYRLWKYLASKRQLTNVNTDGIAWTKGYQAWKWQKANQVKPGQVKEISYGYWPGYSAYNEKWVYLDGLYQRYNGGQLSVDYNTKKPITTNNLVILFARESKANDGYPNNVHLIYQNIGQGRALIFYKGKAIKAKWHKKDLTSRTIFTDLSGKEIKFVAGKIWISMLPSGNKVSY